MPQHWPSQSTKSSPACSQTCRRTHADPNIQKFAADGIKAQRRTPKQRSEDDPSETSLPQSKPKRVILPPQQKHIFQHCAKSLLLKWSVQITSTLQLWATSKVIIHHFNAADKLENMEKHAMPPSQKNNNILKKHSYLTDKLFLPFTLLRPVQAVTWRIRTFFTPRNLQQTGHSVRNPSTTVTSC